MSVFYVVDGIAGLGFFCFYLIKSSPRRLAEPNTQHEVEAQ